MHHTAAADLKLREYKHLPQTLMADVARRRTPHLATAGREGVLLCVSNFPANTGYAWDFIETIWARLADRLAPRGVQTWVAYPLIEAAPRTLQASSAVPVHLDVKLSLLRGLRTTVRFIRKRRVRILYLADRPAWHPAYGLLRIAGVRHIIVHDHSSGARTVPRGLKRLLKSTLRRVFPSMLADVVIGVSNYVVRRKLEVDLVPASRVYRVWNSLDVPPLTPGAVQRLHEEFGLPEHTMVVICACRAAREKGVDYLLRAFDRVGDHFANAALIYVGDGPDLSRLRTIRSKLEHADRVCFAGFRSDAADLIAGADVCAVPSVWEEAFGLSVLEPMVRGVPVVASRVGGIPEVVVDGETGLLVPAADEAALSVALMRLLSDPEERSRMGANGRSRARQQFSMDAELDQLVALIEPSLAMS
jgi:glycosyltransferase involved in cell wall biosynthesis